MTDLLPEVFSRHEIPSVERLNDAVAVIKNLQNQAGVRSQGYYDRLQRGSSWLAKAARADSDPEAAFIFSWIALNALAAVRHEVFKDPWWKCEQEDRPQSKFVKPPDDQSPHELEWFLWRMCLLENGDKLLRGVIKDCWTDVRMILRTPYVMSVYWMNCRVDEDIKRRLRSSERTVSAACTTLDPKMIYQALCEIIIWRLRTLRNQIFHGCATDIHSKRRIKGESELEAGSRVLIRFLWSFLTLMANDIGQKRYWPPAPYPRAGSSQHQRFNSLWLSAPHQLETT